MHDMHDVYIYTKLFSKEENDCICIYTHTCTTLLLLTSFDESLTSTKFICVENNNMKNKYQFILRTYSPQYIHILSDQP